MRRLLFFLVFPAALFVLPFSGYSQTKATLSGTVTDSIGKPLPFVTIRVFKQNNLQLVLQTSLSKENGAFQFNKPDSGTYTLTFTHSGFEEKKQNVLVKRGGDMIIEQVALFKTPATLAEVVVKTQRPLVEQADDRIIFNVEDDPATKSETAIDILRKTPFVTVDGEDNIKVNGKSNFKVLLNNRETSMFARNIKEALRGFPGAVISKIEVITSPSAKYDGEGIGGLINIITKKKVVGYNGTISSFSRTSDKLDNVSLNANAKFGSIGASIFYNIGGNRPVPQQNITTTIPAIPNVFSKRTLEGERRNSGGWNFGNAEMSWEVDTLNTLSVYTNIDSWTSRTVSAQTITTDFVGDPSVTSFYDLDNKSNNPGINVGSDYIKKFRKNKEREFSLRFYGEFGKSESHVNSTQDNPVTDRFLVNNSNAVNNQYTIQADHSIPIKKAGKFEGGVKAILRRASSDFESLVKYNPLASYKLNPSNTDNFKYSQDVISVYSMYTMKIKKSTFRMGARIENTSVDGNFITSNTIVKNNYLTLLPNVQFTNRLSEVTTMVVSYNKRLSRPYIWDLNPFVFNNDSLNISFGNPQLGPQTIHSVSTQLRYGKGSTFAGINIEGSYSGNKILEYASFDPQTGITKTTSLNIGKEFQSSVNLNLNTKITPKWSLFMNGSLRYITVTNNENKTQSNSGFGSNFNMSTSYRFSPKFAISSFLGLWKDPVTIQTTYPFTTWYNFAVNYKILKNKLNISVRTVNYLEKRRSFLTIVKDPNFYNTSVNTQIRRGAVLSLTWSFGKLTENVSKKKGVSNDDLLTKPQAPSGN
ncbi:MAG: TonB-dependent receptor [Ferruginibacter sp.]|nr:TonB-dependent receptor [Chitinophagaceae bacterium]